MRGNLKQRERTPIRGNKRRRWELIIPVIFVVFYFGINLITWSKNNAELNRLSSVLGVSSDIPVIEATPSTTPTPTIFSGLGGPHIEATSIDISGTVWTAENKSTNIGSGVNISLAVNGGVKTTIATGAGGTFTFSGISVTAGDPLVIFIDDGANHGNLVSRAKESTTTGLDLYTNHIVLRHEDAGPISNANLATADNSDAEIRYAVSGGNVVFENGYTIWIDSSKTFTPGGTVEADDFKIPGTGVFNAAANNITIHGSWFLDATSTLTITTGGAQQITFDSGSAETFASGGTDGNHDFNNFIWSGVGSLTLNSAGLMVNGTFSSNSGTFVSTSGTLYANNTFIVAAGTFSANGGTVEFDTISASYTITPNSNTFNNVTFDRLAGSIANDINMTLAGAFIIGGNLVGKCEHATSGKNLNVIVASGNPTVTVNGNLSLPDTPGVSGSIKLGSTTAGNNFTLAVKGDITISDSAAYLYTHTTMNSTSHDQALNINAGTVSTGNWVIDNNGYTVTLTGNLVPAGTATFTLTSGGFNMQNNNFNFGGAFLLTSGTFTQGNGTITIGGAFTMNNGTFSGGAGNITTGPHQTVAINAGSFTSTSGTFRLEGAFTRAAGATFSHHNGTFKFYNWGTASYNITTNNCTFNNVIFGKDTGTGATTAILQDSFSVAGNFTAQNEGTSNNYTLRSTGSINPTITITGALSFPSTPGSSGLLNYGSTTASEKFNVTVISGNFTVNDAGVYVYTDITLNNTSADQVVTTSSYAAIGGDWIIDKGSYTARWDTNMTLGNGPSSGNFTLTSGTVNLQSYTLSINGNYAQSNGTFNGTSGGLTLGTSSTFTLSGGIFNSPDSMTVPSYFTLSGTSTFNAPSGTLTIKNSFSRAGTVNFNHNSGMVVLDDSTNIGYTLTTNNIIFNNLTITRTGGGVLTYDLYQQDSFTVNGNLSVMNEQAQTFEIRGHNGGAIHPTITVNGNVDFPSTAAAGVLNYGDITYYFSLNVKGNFTMSDSNITNKTDTTFSGTSADQIITISAGTYSTTSWTVDNGGGSYAVKPANAITINNLTITSGTWYTGGQNLTVATAFSNNGTFRLQGGETTLSFIRDTTHGTVEYVGDGGATGYGSLLYGDTYWNLTINSTSGSNTWTLNHLLDINGPNGIVITNGTLATGGFNITDAGNWTKGGSGNFTHGGGTVTFDGADSSTQTIDGSTTFNNFVASTASNSTGRTLAFVINTTQTISGTWTITGYAGKVIALAISIGAPSDRWIISPTAASVTYVNVNNSTNSGASFCATYSTGSNNTNWNISAGGMCGPTISGTVYTNEAKSGNIGAGHNIGLSVDGAAKTTVASGAGGTFSFTSVTIAANNMIAIFIDDDVTYEGTLISQAVDASSNITGLEMYTNKVVLRHETAGPITNPYLWTAKQSGDSDIHYTATSGGTVTVDFDAGFEVWVDSGKTYNSQGTVSGDDLDVNGAITMGAFSWTFSGNVDFTGGTVNADTSTLTMTGNSKTIIGSGQTFNRLTISGSVSMATSSLTVSNTLLINNSNSFNAAGLSLSIGTLDNNGTLSLTGGETLSITTMDTNSGTVLYYGAGAGPYTIKDFGVTDYYALTINPTNGTDTFQLGNDLQVNGTLTLSTGTLTTTATNYALNIGDASISTGSYSQTNGIFTANNSSITCFGNYSITGGTYNANTSTLTLDTTSQNIILTSNGYTLNNVNFKNNSNTSPGSVGLGAGTLAFAGNFYLDAANTQLMTVTAVANIPNVNIAGNLDFIGLGAGSESLLMGNGTWTVTGNVDFSDGSITAGNSTLLMDGSNKMIISNNQILYNLTTSGTISPSGDLTISNVFNISAGAFTAGGSIITLSGSGTPFIRTGSFTYSVSTVKYTGSSATNITAATYYNLYLDHSGTTFTAAGDITATNILAVSSGTFDASSRTITLSGSGTPLVVSGAFTSSSSTIKYTGSSPTNITSTIYNNLTLDNVATTFTAAGDMTINSILIISSGDFDASNRTITLAGSGTTFLIAGTFTPSSSTIKYTGTSATTITNTTYNNLTIDQTGTTFSAGGSFTVGGVLNVNAGNFAALNRTITLSGSGTPFVISGTFTPLTSTIKYTGALATNITGTTYANLTLDHLGTNFNASGSITVNSVLNINTGTFDGSNKTINLDGSGTPLVISGSFTASTSTVNYNGGLATNVANTNYYNLGFTGGGTYSLGAALVAKGALSLSNGILDTTGAGFGVTIGDAATTNGSFSQTNGILNLNNSTITCYGSYSVTGGTYNAGVSTLTLDATPQNLSLIGNGYHFNNLNFRNNSAVSSRTITLASALGETINFANFYLEAANSKNITVSAVANHPTINISGGVDYTGLGTGAEIIDMGNSTFNVNGNIDFSGGAINSGSSTLSLNGSAAQTLTSFGQSLYNLIITNSSAGGIIMADSSTITNDFINNAANSKVTFHAGSTYTITNIDLNGQAAGTRVQLRSSTPSTQWFFNVSGTQTVAFVDVRDSNASGGNQINAVNDCLNSGNNLNWLFAVASVGIVPASATLNPGGVQKFVATAYDGSGFPIPGTIFNWSVVAGGGSIDNSGNFAAGAALGTFNNTVQATASGVNGFASVTVTAAPIPPTPSPTATTTPSGGESEAQVSVPETVIVDNKAVFDASGLAGYVSYHWDFGDGNQADGAKVTHRYKEVNRYNVILTLTDKAGQETRKSYQVDAVPPVPELTKISSRNMDITLEGNSYPISEVILTIESDPWQTQADTNNEGKFVSNFNYNETKLAFGEHKIIIYAQKQIASGAVLKSGTKEYDAYFNLNNGELEAKIKQLEEQQRRLIIICVITGSVILILFLILFFLWRRKKREKAKTVKLRTGYS